MTDVAPVDVDDPLAPPPLPDIHQTSRGALIAQFDDMLDRAQHAAVYKFLQRPGWTYGWKSNPHTDVFSFLHKHFAGFLGEGDARPKNPDCARELEVKAPFIYQLWLKLSDKLLNRHTLVRCYANGYPYGSDGTLHTDSELPNSYTTIYYPHETWQPNWAGETVLFNDERNDILTSVYPKPNRLIVFRGATPHAARGVSRTCPVLRITLMFKTEIQDD